MKEKVKYYEVEFDHDIRSREHGNETIGFYSICIRAMREPSYEEAEEFCKNDMMAMKMEHVVAIREIDDYESHQFFDMDEEERYPIFR